MRGEGEYLVGLDWVEAQVVHKELSRWVCNACELGLSLGVPQGIWERLGGCVGRPQAGL
jgi:hypothetical protein